MRKATILALMLSVLAAGEATAAAARRPPPPPTPRAAPPRPVASVPPPAPMAFAPLGSSLLATPLAGLPSLSQAGDPRPQCRTDCATRRYMCTDEAADCAERWSQCLATCR